MMAGVDRTLAEQMRFSDREIDDRKRLLGLDDDDVKALTACKDHIYRTVNELVERFYGILVATPENAVTIGDAETLARLKVSMRRYILELFEGYYDATYVNRRLRVGKVHHRIGVSPKLYTSAVRLLQSLLDAELDCIVPATPEVMLRRRQALHKVMLFDLQLVFDTYIASLVAEVEMAKIEVEHYAQSLEEKVSERTRQLAELSARDALTGLYNQRSFYETLRRELAAGLRTAQPLTLAYFDLNGFKKVNDEQGHRAGDAILALVGKTLLATVRETDIACRYGGDEFCIVMPRTTLEQGEMVCRRLMAAFDAQDSKGVTFSIGLVEADGSAETDSDQMVRTADALMYGAKAEARKAPGHYLMNRRLDSSC